MSNGTAEGTRRVLRDEAVSAGLGDAFVEPISCIEGTLLLRRMGTLGTSLSTFDARTETPGEQLWRVEVPR